MHQSSGGSLSARLREATVDALLTARVLQFLQRLTRQSGVVLLYHSVADGEGNPYLSEGAFRDQMEMLRAEFRILSSSEFRWHSNRRKPLPRGSVLITFDDGYKNNRTAVQPTMERLQMPWVVFVTTQQLEKPDSHLWMSQLRAICQFTPSEEVVFAGQRWSLQNGRRRAYKDLMRWCSSTPSEMVENASREAIDRYGHLIPDAYADRFCALMGADDIQTLLRSGLVEVGVHTQTHPFLPRVSSARLDDEVSGAKRQLEQYCECKARMFAYPSGRYGRRELLAVARAGFECAFAVIPQLSVDPTLEIPRIGVYSESVATLRAKCLGAASMLRAVRVNVG